MRGLLLKDLYNMWKYCKSFLLIILVFTGMSFVNEGNAFYVFYPIIMISLIPISLLAYDEREHWDAYCMTLPVKRNTCVSVKYIESLTGGIVMALVTMTITVIQGHTPMNLGTVGENVIMMIAIALIPPAIILPINFLLGTTKARISQIVVVAILVGCSSIFVIEEDITWLGEIMNSSAFTGILLAAAVAIFTVSWRVSLIFYSKRDIY